MPKHWADVRGICSTAYCGQGSRNRSLVGHSDYGPAGATGSPLDGPVLFGRTVSLQGGEKR